MRSFVLTTCKLSKAPTIRRPLRKARASDSRASFQPPPPRRPRRGLYEWRDPTAPLNTNVTTPRRLDEPENSLFFLNSYYKQLQCKTHLIPYKIKLNPLNSFRGNSRNFLHKLCILFTSLFQWFKVVFRLNQVTTRDTKSSSLPRQIVSSRGVFVFYYTFLFLDNISLTDFSLPVLGLPRV